RQTDAEDHHGEADGDGVDPRPVAQPGVQCAHQQPGERGNQDAEPRRAGQVADGVGGHRAHDQRPFEAEIDPPGLLGDALPEADEQERGPDADRTAEDGQRQGPEPELVHVVTPSWTPAARRVGCGGVSGECGTSAYFGSKIENRPYSVSNSRITTKIM